MISQQAMELAVKVRELVTLWIKGVDGIRQKDLMGACGIASYTLWLAYRARGIHSDLVVNDDHCWVEIDALDGTGVIVDVTATQFNRMLPDVYLGPVEMDNGHYDYRNPLFKNREAVNELLGWWEPQRPLQFADKIQEFVDGLRVDKST